MIFGRIGKWMSLVCLVLVGLIGGCRGNNPPGDPWADVPPPNKWETAEDTALGAYFKVTKFANHANLTGLVNQLGYIKVESTKASPYDDEYMFWLNCDSQVMIIQHKDQIAQPIGQPTHVQEGSTVDTRWDSSYNPKNGCFDYLGASNMSGPHLVSKDRYPVQGSGWLEIKGTAHVRWYDLLTEQAYEKQFNIYYKVYLRQRTSRVSMGPGGLTLAVADLSQCTGWSGINGIPFDIELMVPQGEQFDNVTITAEVTTAEDYLSQPYYDMSLVNDFTFTWTKHTGNPSWGWLGTSNLGTVTADQQDNLLVDLVGVPYDDTTQVSVTVSYTYQGNPTTISILYPVQVWGD